MTRARGTRNSNSSKSNKRRTLFHSKKPWKITDKQETESSSQPSLLEEFEDKLKESNFNTLYS